MMNTNPGLMPFVQKTNPLRLCTHLPRFQAAKIKKNIYINTALNQRGVFAEAKLPQLFQN